MWPHFIRAAHNSGRSMRTLAPGHTSHSAVSIGSMVMGHSVAPRCVHCSFVRRSMNIGLRVRDLDCTPSVILGSAPDSVVSRMKRCFHVSSTLVRGCLGRFLFAAFCIVVLACGGTRVEGDSCDPFIFVAIERVSGLSMFSGLPGTSAKRAPVVGSLVLCLRPRGTPRGSWFCVACNRRAWITGMSIRPCTVYWLCVTRYILFGRL